MKQVVDSEPNKELESLKNQIEGIAEMLAGLNSMCEPQMTHTPKSTKREAKRKRSTSNKKEKEESPTITIEDGNKDNSVMPQRKLKTIKIKKVQRIRR